ncbi:2912_t:CDS:2 [Ambispora gerdemannii]|uniref:2912_t:CDS:1 n=1 Tax=Ambispora gerdemannii TaxID=144530 RepID=A0A9N8ZGV5_9GLOM|nr:2912_t:CDS:2 [Ambispora gerdemannii]
MAQNHSHTSRRQAASTGETVPQERYQKLKRRVREVQAENEKVNAELDRARKRIKTLKREKDMLLDRISQFEGTDSSDSEKSVNLSSIESSDSEVSSQANSRASSVPSIRTAVKKTANNIVNTVPITHTPPAKVVPQKRASKRPLNTKTMKVQHVAKDDRGNYLLPVQIGILTVISLGTVVYDRETFHNERYIWPVGYAVKRSYNSMINPDAQTMYTCKIEDGGEGPRFVIEAEDQPGKPITANTATGAWTTVVREANAIRHRDHSNSASGPDYFGFSQATIRKMIQDLPNATRCKKYTTQNFEVMKTRNNGGRKRGGARGAGTASTTTATTNGKASGSGATNGISASTSANNASVAQTPTPRDAEERSSSNDGSANGDGDIVMSDVNDGDSEEE